ncbi:MAG TPA: indolepyruvate ferredoxin oxidoreductase family protein [Candidatus Corynebacterium gallistercoris]|uniref:Indolepyruvate ferredoxin oxidoreductase family protein n=1 Tax=Candidatus Corynebacterium gallistercoris TaxID=2838530 RepID=A0A9D1S1J2_9CORY|nr:indolepyruvate ferredoxin oxidoreductase family protein [Candidatus Corynebacterium gallistercoris]
MTSTIIPPQGANPTGAEGSHAPNPSRNEIAHRYTAETGSVHLTGIQALVRMIRDRAIADRKAGLRTASFISGYEGSPLGGYDLELAKRGKILGEHRIVHTPAVNEELGATAVAGSQLTGGATLQEDIDGVVGYWYGKAPGLDRSADALRHANTTGAHGKGGAVAIVGDDPKAKSSTVPSNSSRIIADLGMPTLVPADSADILSLGMHAAWMSRYSGLWTALRVTTPVADGSSTVTLDGPLTAPDVANDKHMPDARLLGQRLLELDRTRTGVRLERAMEYARKHNLNRLLHGDAEDTVGIICAGNTALEVQETLRQLVSHGQAPERVRVLRLGMTWPLDPCELNKFAIGLEHIIVAEELGNHLLETVRTALYGADNQPEISHVNNVPALLGTTLDKLGIDVKLPEKAPRRIALPLNVESRVPHFCSGCPHNASTRATPDTLVGAGIGCHAMVMIMDPNRVGNILGTAQMGGEGSHFIGMSPFIKEKHFVQNMGDGTFLHSGSLALRALVAAKANVTMKLLHNGTVAMTGGQDPVGQPSLAGLVDMVQAENPARIVVTTDDVARTRKILREVRGSGVEIKDRADLAAVQKDLAETPGVTVLIHDQHCAAEKRRAISRGKQERSTTRVIINERICEGCGDCGEKSGCLSVQPVDSQFGRKTRIDQSTCNSDFTCLKGDCPAFTTVEVTKNSAGAAKRSVTPVGVDQLPTQPAPEQSPKGRSWNVRISGVGGTGVLTLSAVIATAAQLDGKFVRGNDMTGLAQKGGSVISDVRISALPVDEPGAVPEAGADLVIAMDGITAAEDTTIKTISATRTTAVLSSADTPTGRMCTDVKATRPDGVQLAGALGKSAHRAVTTNSIRLSNAIFGESTYQTMILLGVALQAGALPVSAEAIEKALTANGRKVEENIQAFRWGRLLIADPQRVEDVLDNAPEAGADMVVDALPSTVGRVRTALQMEHREGGEVADELVHFVAVRVDEMARWGTEQDATAYLDDVCTMYRQELRVAGAGSHTLTKEFAFGLHKLNTYKDEYEVARLAHDEGFHRQVDRDFGDDVAADVKVMLQPPLLRAMGLDRKIALGKWSAPALKALAGMKKVRGTKLDIFGYAGVRRLERELKQRYREELLRRARSMTSASDVADVAELAAAADGVRGFEDKKLDSGRELLELLDR